MICVRRETGWEVVHQRAHALLAMQLAFPWRSAERPFRWVETLAAIAQHDHGWQEGEAKARLTALGTPRSFDEVELEIVTAQARRVLHRAWHQSIWVALLISRHMDHLYAPCRDEHAPLADLLDEQAQNRRRWRKALGVKQEEVDAAYALLLWADTLSLTLCRDQLPFGARAVEIGAGPDGQRYDARRRQDGTLSVEPWPYEEARFEVAVETYCLRQLTFDTYDAFEQTLSAAKPTQRRWTLAAT